MKFWDSSAIIPLLISERQTPLCRQLLEQDPEMLVWVLTPTEIYSACHRKIREGVLGDKEFDAIRTQLQILEAGWSSVVQLHAVQSIARRLLAVHTLRAADALQLAAALVAFDQEPNGAEFISFDDGLNRAARREGFQVI